MLYEKNKRLKLTQELFENPTSEYRGAPFWAWNTVLEKEKLEEQIQAMQTMGMGGYHIHVRTGMATSYLSDEFMDYVKYCIKSGEEKGMLTWLYDEDRWPSGTAGGKVTKAHPEYCAKNLLFTRKPYGTAGPVIDLGTKATGRGGNREENGPLLGVYDVVLKEDGSLDHYRRILEDEDAEGAKWYAYMEYAVPSAWFNNQPYIDVLDDRAVKSFIEITHERYKECVGEEFGKSIPSIFTDEPGFAIKGTLNFADEERDVFLPWSDHLEDKYQTRYGESLLDHLPELFWEQPEGGISVIRYHYHDFLTELFATNFCDVMGNWCEKNNLMLAGHVLHEETLLSQTRVIGEAMRSYRGFKDMPGIDILCDFHEYNTAKQCQSVKHQQGNQAMLSELYGVTGWDYDFRGFKLQGDWQAALGVTVRVPHLFWMSMKGEAKRDYPPCIGPQSPWWKEFSYVENHFARLNTAMTRGKIDLHIGVIHPIESYWLFWGPKEQTHAIRNQLEQNFADLTEILIFGMIDFDFISESLLPDQCEEGSNPLQVGAMKYDVVIVPACKTLRRTTVERLKAFQAQGGRLIFLGECPELVDAVPSDEIHMLYEGAEQVPFSKIEILKALESERSIEVRGENGAYTDYLIHQLRIDEDCKWLYIARGKNPVSEDVDDSEQVRITIKGQYIVECYDTLTGIIAPVEASYSKENTVLRRRWYTHDSLLLKLIPFADSSEVGKEDGQTAAAFRENYVPGYHVGEAVDYNGLVDVILHEPNALLLDMAQWAYDGGDWEGEVEEELLRIDNECRNRLGIAKRAKHVLQPYLLEPEKTEHTLKLRFNIRSEITPDYAALALEDAADTKIWLNGQEVPSVTNGWYVDTCIETVPLPTLIKGENVLEVEVPIGKRTNLEWMYLVGDFGVKINGTMKTITEPVRKLGFGSIVSQGLPFYTGNITYKCRFTAGGNLSVRVPKYRGGLIRASLDNQDAGVIAYAPYMLDLENVPDGEHILELTLYGTRQNGFAQVHHDQTVYFYQSPDSWRSVDDYWLDEYQLKEVGILKKPEIRKL